MFAYSPDKFASLYASELGQRIWAFLTRPEQVARLETASELSKPAVEGIVETDSERIGRQQGSQKPEHNGRDRQRPDEPAGEAGSVHDAARR